MDLLTIFKFDTKANLERYCRDVMVTQRAFANIVLACEKGMLPFVHRVHWTDSVPEHLTPNDDWAKALSAMGVRPRRGAARRVARKTLRLFAKPRHLVGHLFYRPNHEWHF